MRCPNTLENVVVILFKTRKTEEEKVLIKITSLSQRSPAGLSGEEKMELSELQDKLDNIETI